MNVDYQLRSRNGDTLFKIYRSRLHRRLQYLERAVEGTISSQERPDSRPGVEAPETIYVLTEPGSEPSTGTRIAVERHDEARLQGYASLRSEPVALQPPRSAAALVAFAEKAKNGGSYEAANAAFALTLTRHFPRIECSLSVREKEKTPTGSMTTGYYDLAYVRPLGDVPGSAEETCIPVPKLRGEVAYWFAAHAERREPQRHNRTSTGMGPTLGDLEVMLGREDVREAVRAVLCDDALDDHCAGSTDETPTNSSREAFHP